MKKLFPILFITMLVGCKSAKFPSTGETTYYAQNKDILIVNSVGYGYKIEDAKTYAQKQALNNLIYNGVANSNYKNPMVDYQQIDKIKPNLDKYINTNYLQFIQNTSLISNTKNKKVYTQLYRIEINTLSLRDAMEREGFVRKFGF